MRILNCLAFFYLAAIHLGTESALVRFLTIIVVVAALLPFVGAYQDWTDTGRGRDISGILPRSFGIATYTNPNHYGAFLATVRSEESRLESLSDPSGLGDLDESDPRSVARWMRCMGREMGEDVGDDFDEAVEELEAGGAEDAGDGWRPEP